MSGRKLKLAKVPELVIGGYKSAAGSFQSILAGYYENDELMFAGKVRQGFNPASRTTFAKDAASTEFEMSVRQSADE